uniref:Uncharacterized protein n=1 Tax=Tetranychus urticae TaxID=32264 RepID=T1KWL5_TETUR
MIIFPDDNNSKKHSLTIHKDERAEKSITILVNLLLDNKMKFWSILYSPF